MAEIKLISVCFVKPMYEVEAAKKPHHLSPSELTLLSINPIQKGLLFSLNNNNNNNNPCSSDNDRTKLVSHLLEKLKHSLSIALVHFYPLAGRFATIKYPDEHACSIFVDCVKGPGARVIRATALDATISSVISSSTDVQSMFDLGEKWVNYDSHTRALLSIQVTELVDGVFIGFTINHSVADGTSFIHFVSMLSEIYKSQVTEGSESTIKDISRVPIFNYKTWVDYSLDNKSVPDDVLKLPYLEQEEFIVRQYESGPLRERIFHFSPTSMATLKARANQECGTTTQNVISSFQALSALVWRCITQARYISSDQITSYSLLINTRSRFDPPLTDDYFGNIIYGAKNDCNVGELLTNTLGWVAMRIHEEIRTFDNKNIREIYKVFAESPMVIQPGDVGQEVHGQNKVIVGGSTRFDMYGPEFGLGRAIAARTGFANKEDGKVTANMGRAGRGSVDLEICLKPHFMDALEGNAEFMSFVSS